MLGLLLRKLGCGLLLLLHDLRLRSWLERIASLQLRYLALSDLLLISIIRMIAREVIHVLDTLIRLLWETIRSLLSNIVVFV